MLSIPVFWSTTTECSTLGPSCQGRVRHFSQGLSWAGPGMKPFGPKLRTDSDLCLGVCLAVCRSLPLVCCILVFQPAPPSYTNRKIKKPFIGKSPFWYPKANDKRRKEELRNQIIYYNRVQGRIQQCLLLLPRCSRRRIKPDSSTEEYIYN